MSSQYGELWPTSGWDRLTSLEYPCKFQWVSHLGSITAWHSSSGCQPNFVALKRGRHLYSVGRPSRWGLAHISSWLCFLCLVWLMTSLPPCMLIWKLLMICYKAWHVFIPWKLMVCGRGRCVHLLIPNQQYEITWKQLVVLAWLSDSALVSINKVTLCRAWLVLGWVTVCGRVNQLCL